MDDPEIASVSYTLKKIIHFIKPYTPWVLLCMVASMFKIAIELLIAYFIQNITDTAQFGQMGMLFRFVVFIMMTMIAGIFVRYIIKYSTGRYSAYVVRDIQGEIIRRLVKMNVAGMEKVHSGDTISRFATDSARIQDFLENDIADFCYQPLIFIGALVYLFKISIKMLALNIMIALLITLVSALLTKSLSNHTRKLLEQLGSTNSLLQDVIGGIYILKSFNLERVLYKRYKLSAEKIYKKSMKVEAQISSIMPVFMVLNVFPNIVCILFGGYLLSKGELYLSGLLTFLYLLNNILEPTNRIPDLLQNFSMFRGAAARVFEMLEYPQERRDGKVANPASCAEPIQFIDVSFSYDGKVRILDKLNFNLCKGKITALVGESGCGKSTVIKLISGINDLNEGSIKLYGYDLREWKSEEARKLISLVEQDTYLFPVTIAENISYGRPDATMDEIVEAARIANIHDFILSLPEKYHSIVGDGGIKLSGGQKQRISIARAILKDAPILLMDEPTSALDMQSEALVQNALVSCAKERAILVVAHRLCTIKGADEILVLDQGQVVERGTHERLMEGEGLYREMYQNQWRSSNSAS